MECAVEARGRGDGGSAHCLSTPNNCSLASVGVLSHLAGLSTQQLALNLRCDCQQRCGRAVSEHREYRDNMRICIRASVRPCVRLTRRTQVPFLK
jgi:hypothetical protein